MTTTKKAAPKGAATTPKKTATKKPSVKKETPIKEVEETKDEVNSNPVVKTDTPTEEQSKETQDPGSDTKSVRPGLTIVIPFRANKAKGGELIYALRAWEKHLPKDLVVNIVLVGDTLPELSGKVLHVPHKPVSDNPQIDVASKMAAAIASDLVPELFIWSNDDIYCVSDITQADLEILKAVPGGLKAKGSPDSIYRENGLRTLKALKDVGIEKPFDYASHTPVLFEKEKLAKTLATFKCTKEGHLVSSLYFNSHFPTVRPIILDNTGRGSVVASVFKENPNPEVLPTIFDTQKWVNNNDRGWKSVEPYLAKLFPKKSAFEK